MLFIQLADNAAGIADGHRIGRDIFYHYTSCSYDATVANSYSRAYRDTTSQPAVLTNGDWGASFYKLTTLNIIYRMVWSQELAVRANLGVGTNSDDAPVEHRAVVVDEDFLTQFDTMTVVTLKRRHYGG